jgi:predicted nucleic acid-binding protein
MKTSVYLETTIISYLTAWPSRDLLVASCQQVTRQWWEESRSEHQLYVSRIVLDEIRSGDSQASQERLAVIEAIPTLEVTKEVVQLAQVLLQQCIPAKAANDTLHISIAANNGIDYLLTWNCRHIANPRLRRDIHRHL